MDDKRWQDVEWGSEKEPSKKDGWGDHRIIKCCWCKRLGFSKLAQMNGWFVMSTDTGTLWWCPKCRIYAKQVMPTSPERK